MSSILSQRDKDLVSNYLVGGAAAGGGLALATALINYLRHLKDEKEDSEEDDDTIKIYRQAPQEKVAMTLGGPLALTGGLVSAAGTYALVNKLYEMLRKKQAQEKLDEAQNIFLESQGYKKAPKEENKKDKEEETEKSASGKGMSVSELGVSIPLALPILMALGSGVVAHKLLNKSFPIKKRKVESPKRIEIVDAPPPEEEEEEDLAKAAGVTDTDGLEFLIRTVNMAKSASSDISNLVATVADGRIGDFKKIASDIGFADALDTVKGAAKYVEAEPLTEQLAISCLAKSAAIGEQTKLLAAAEFADIYPTFFKAASRLNEKKQNALFKIACILGNAIRSEISEEAGIEVNTLTKKADIGAALFESVLSRDEAPDGEKSESNDSSDTSQEETGIKKKKKNKFVYSSKRGFRLAKKLQDDDVIDKILSPGK